MKTIKNTVQIKTLLVLMVLAITTLSYAGPKKGEDDADRTTLKAREAVAKASSDDWYTYANAARKCIRKKVNMKEANEWLEKSIQIKETSYNLEVKGDYYMANKLPEKALELYVKSIEVGKTEKQDFDASGIQQKIMDIHNQKL